eukprot:340276-Amphidinium_carterae.2
MAATTHLGVQEQDLFRLMSHDVEYGTIEALCRALGQRSVYGKKSVLETGLPQRKSIFLA